MDIPSESQRTPLLARPERSRNETTKTRRPVSISSLVVTIVVLGLVLSGLNSRVTNSSSSSSTNKKNNEDEDEDDNFVSGNPSNRYEKVGWNGSDNDDGNDDEMTFEAFLRRFDKSYDHYYYEYSRRSTIFSDNLETIRAHNNAIQSNGKRKHNWTMGVNHFADVLPDEIPRGFDKSSLHGSRAHEAFSDTTSHLFSTLSSLPTDRIGTPDATSTSGRRNLRSADWPESIDWRARSPSVITPVKDQGLCGSCWAFAAASVLESHLAIATGKLLSLSPQELVSCAPNYNHCGGDGGCSGSTAELAYDYVAEHGLVTEWAAGYTSYYGKSRHCHLQEDHDGYFMDAKASVDGFSSLPTNSYDSLMYAVGNIGPVVLSVAASNWTFYSGGVLDDSDMTSHYDINHAVVLEGYGTDEETGEDYWLVRNSWGVEWGENGYIRLKRTDPSTLRARDPLSVSSGFCKMDITPFHGVACPGAFYNETINDQLVCGTSGILYANVIPVGAHLFQPSTMA